MILNVRMVVWADGRVVLRRRERHADGYERIIRLVVRGDGGRSWQLREADAKDAGEVGVRAAGGIAGGCKP